MRRAVGRRTCGRACVRAAGERRAGDSRVRTRRGSQGTTSRPPPASPLAHRTQALAPLACGADG